MNDEDLTPWFDGATAKPKRHGVYMLMSGALVGYQRWDGTAWGPWDSDADIAAQTRPGDYASASYQNDNWRGLRKRHNAPAHRTRPSAMTTDMTNNAPTDDCHRTAGAGPVQRSVSGLPSVAVLFAREDSTYKAMPQCDVYDMERDARTYDGPHPVVAHPPCRAWGRLRSFANPRPDERNLARLAVAMVREFGGVLEHPAGSTLWPAQKLPRPGERDSFGGWTLAAPQKWWGHKAEKETWFYVVGCEPRDQPDLPFVMAEATHVVQSRKRDDYRPHITKAEREHTPPELARWLVELAGRCKPANS